MNNKCTLIFDVGKTNVKLMLLDQNGRNISTVKRNNQVINKPPYPHFDIEGIWQWLITEIRELTPNHHIGAIAISTHGAAAAFVDIDEQELILPIMDYEFDEYPENMADYDLLRPGFNQSYSPKFPAGLNLGKQLYHQNSILSEEQKKKATLLFYTSFWAWRLTGIAASEITSIGCHTDLWDMTKKEFSRLIDVMDLNDKIPAIVLPWQPLGKIKKEITIETGLDEDCLIFPGIHDSNAGLVPYLNQEGKK